MIRQLVCSLLLQALAKLCDRHIPTVMTEPTYCARCWREIPKGSP